MRKRREGERPIKTNSYETRVVKGSFGQPAFHFDGVVFLEAGIVYTATSSTIGREQCELENSERKR